MPSIEILGDLLHALETNKPIPQRARIPLIYGIRDFMAADNADLAVCLGIRGTRNARLRRNYALRRIRDKLDEPCTEKLIEGIFGLIEQARLSPESPEEPELLRLARFIKDCGVRLPGKRQLRSILELK